MPSAYNPAAVNAILAHAHRASPNAPAYFVASALVESGLNPRAVGDGGNSFGLFQLNRHGRLKTAGLMPDQAFDPETNARVSADEFRTFYNRGARGASLAARAQRPADPAGYQRKIEAALPEARRLLRQGAPSGAYSPSGQGAAPGSGGGQLTPASMKALQQYLTATERQVLSGQAPTDPFGLLGRLQFTSPPASAGAGIDLGRATGSASGVKPGGGWAGSEGAIKSITALPAGFSATSEKRDRQHTSSGGVSDHWSGNKTAFARDIGWGGSSPTPAADSLASRIVSSLGGPKGWGKKGGNFTVTRNGFRFQVLYRTNVGGNHFNHIHVGARRA